MNCHGNVLDDDVVESEEPRNLKDAVSMLRDRQRLMEYLLSSDG